MPRVKLIYADRAAALTPRQLAGQLRYGSGGWGRWERTPDVIARWTMFDRNLSREGAATIARIIAVAYSELAGA